MFLYRKALFPELEERHMARVLAMPKGRSQLTHSHSCLRQKFPSMAEMKSTSSWEAKGESGGWTACCSGVVSGAAVLRDDASLHRGGGSRAGDGVASPVERAEEQQQGQQAASVAHHQLQRGWGSWLCVLVALSLLLIAK